VIKKCYNLQNTSEVCFPLGYNTLYLGREVSLILRNVLILSEDYYYYYYYYLLFILFMDAVHCYETLKPRVVVVRGDTTCRIASFCGLLEERVASNSSVTEFGSCGKTFVLPFRISEWPQTLQPS
jgi:hypothetical protein